MQESAAALIHGSNRPVSFSGQDHVTVAPGALVWSDPVPLPLVANPDEPLLVGRNLAVSFHVKDDSGPMTWHAKAMVTSYLTPPGAGSVGASEAEDAFPFSTTSWFFLDAVDMMTPADTQVVVTMGDSITDGSASTINGYDRWVDALGRRLHAVYGNRVSVVNAGIGGNRIVGPEVYDLEKPFPGGPAMTQRLERDVLELSGVSSVIWLEAINDFNKVGNASVAAVESGIRDVVSRLRKKLPDIRIVGATLNSVVGSSSGNHGFPEQEMKRQNLNGFIRTSGLFDAVADFDTATLDRATGKMRREFIPDSSVGGEGDGVHPNRAGYLSMSKSIDLKTVLGVR